MKRLTQSEFIDRCRKKHNDKFDYSKVLFKNVREKIIIVCPNHGDILIDAGNHLYRNGCDKCARDKHKLTQLTKERVDNLKKVHSDKYSYEDLSVDSGFINITCKDHGLFTQYLYFHEYGHGCPECNSSSRGEDKIKSILEKNKICFHRNYQFDDCVRTKKLRFDFYLPDLNTIIEYDGEHHFKENKYFGEGNLEYITINDEIKNKYCLENKIKLIRIPYWEFDVIENILIF
jgi:hypothetical protein